MLKRFLLAALLLAAPLSAAPPRDARLPEWMAGTWMMEDGASWTDEIWTDPKGGMMLGVSRSGFGPDLKSWELAQIRLRNDGTMVYTVQLNGQGKIIEFPMVLISEDAIEFANPANEFPQRIRYWRQGKLLMAEASLLDGSNAVRWNYRAVIPPRDEAE